MNIDRKYFFIAFTTDGIKISETLSSNLTQANDDIAFCHYDKSIHLSSKHFVRMAFDQHHRTNDVCLVIVGAVGIAVRLISPFVEDKLKDPAVLVVDDLGRFVISLLSGHIGGANGLALEISKDLKSLGYSAEPVITTATDARGISGIENVLNDYLVPLEPIRQNIKCINMHIAEGGVVSIVVDPLLGRHFEYSKVLVPITSISDVEKSGVKIMTMVITLRSPDVWLDTSMISAEVQVFFSKSLIVGTGCKKNFKSALYLEALTRRLQEEQMPSCVVNSFATIGLKVDETCIKQAATTLDATVTCHRIEDLIAYEPHFSGSEFVKKTTGIAAVAGPSAYHMTHDERAFTVYKEVGCTFSFGRLIR